MSIKTNREYIEDYILLQKECDSVYHNVATEFGLSDCAFWILYTISDTQETITQSAICEAAAMTRQTVNSALKKLEKDKLVELRRIEGKMGKSIHLTDMGITFVKKHIMPIMIAEEKACRSFSEEEKELFLQMFRKLVNRLCEEIKERQEGE